MAKAAADGVAVTSVPCVGDFPMLVAKPYTSSRSFCKSSSLSQGSFTGCTRPLPIPNVCRLLDAVGWGGRSAGLWTLTGLRGPADEMDEMVVLVTS